MARLMQGNRRPAPAVAESPLKKWNPSEGMGIETFAFPIAAQRPWSNNKKTRIQGKKSERDFLFQDGGESPNLAMAAGTQCKSAWAAITFCRSKNFLFCKVFFIPCFLSLRIHGFVLERIMCIIFPPVYSRYWACLINLDLIQLDSTSYFKIFCVFLCRPHDCCLLNPFLVSCYRHQNFACDLIQSLCSLFSSVIKSSAIHQRFVFCGAFWSQLPFSLREGSQWRAVI